MNELQKIEKHLAKISRDLERLVAIYAYANKMDKATLENLLKQMGWGGCWIRGPGYSAT